MVQSENAAIKSFHNKVNNHKNKVLGYARSINKKLNESVVSGTGKISIILHKVIYAEEGISDKTHPFTNKIVNKALDNPSSESVTNNLSAKDFTKKMMKVETNNKANHVDVKCS